jgi:hypothetical protein
MAEQRGGDANMRRISDRQRGGSFSPTLPHIAAKIVPHVLLTVGLRLFNRLRLFNSLLFNRLGLFNNLDLGLWPAQMPIAHKIAIGPTFRAGISHCDVLP